MTLCIAVFFEAGRCHILLNPSVNLVGSYGAKHWILTDWLRPWINLDVVGQK